MDSPGVTPQPASTPLVSVVVPAWNAATTLERAIASVLEERGIDLECVIVDDGSTDDTAAVGRRLAEADPRVRLIESPGNEGVSAARNRALAVARGEWLTFLDGDDRLLPGAIAALVSAALRTDALAVVGQRIWFDGEARWITKQYDQPDIRLPGRKSLVANPGLLFYASTTGKLFHRSLTTGLAFEGRVLGDQPWTVRALLRAGDRIEVIADTVYEWQRPGRTQAFSSITARKRESAALAAEAVLVAIGALRDVRDEARRVVADPVDQHRVTVAYLDRLMRADFAGPVRRALDTRDPASAELFAALDTFLQSVPAEELADAPGVFVSIVRPPLLRWTRLTSSARPAYLAMARRVLRDPVIAAGRGAGSFRIGAAFWLARWLPERAALPAIALVEGAATAPRVVGRRLRALRHAV